MKKFLVVIGLLAGVTATASVKFFSTSGADLGHQSKVACGTNMTCAQSAGKLAIDVKGAPTGLLQARTAATATTLTAAQCGGTFYNSGAVEVDLPEASTVLGCRFTFVTLNAANFDIDPEAGDQILVNTNAAGDRLRNATVGNTVTIEAVSASQWAIVGILGTWSDAD